MDSFIKKELLITFSFFVAPFIFGMEQKAEDKALVAMNEIFKKLDENFLDKGNELFNQLIKSKLGRQAIAQIRIGEITREGSVTNIPGQKIKYVASSNIYDYGATQHLFYQPKNMIPSGSMNDIFKFIEGISSTEEILIVLANINNLSIEAVEDTRIHDLYLLKKMVEEDNVGYMKWFSYQSSLQGFLQRLSTSHASWPPKQHEHLVSVFSGYQVLQKALEIRKKNKIDEKDENGYYEKWSFTSHNKNDS